MTSSLIKTGPLLAKLGGISRATLDRKIASDETFPKPIYVGRLRFFDEEAVEAWMTGRSTARAILRVELVRAGTEVEGFKLSLNEQSQYSDGFLFKFSHGLHASITSDALTYLQACDCKTMEDVAAFLFHLEPALEGYLVSGGKQSFGGALRDAEFHRAH